MKRTKGSMVSTKSLLMTDTLTAKHYAMNSTEREAERIHYRVASTDYGYEVRCVCGFTTKTEAAWQIHVTNTCPHCGNHRSHPIEAPELCPTYEAYVADLQSGAIAR